MSTDDLNTAVPAIDVEHSPARVSSILAVVAGLLAVIASGLLSVLALVFGFLGLVGLAAGLFVLESRRATTIGASIIFFSILLSGFQGNTPPFLVFSTIGTIIAFDLGQNAFSVGAQMSDDTRTQRGELVHAAGSILVGSLAAIVAYIVYLAGRESFLAGDTPGVTVLFLLLGAVFIVWAIRT